MNLPKRLLLIPVLLFGCKAMASDPYPMWEQWRMEVHSIGCALKREYVTSPNVQTIAAYKGVLNDSVFFHMRVFFSAKSVTKGPGNSAKDIGVIRFSLQVVPRGAEVKVQERLNKVIIDGLTMEQNQWSPHMFNLDEQSSLKLMQRLADNKILDYSLHFGNGKVVKSKFYPTGGSSSNNHVWVRMFKTCIAQHKGASY